MSRTRTVVPEFYQHRPLQELEKANPLKYVMLVFSGLWTQCDRCGRFLWNADKLKLAILPWLEFEMAETLAILLEAQFIETYELNGVKYGLCPNLKKYQNFTSRERSAPPKYPAPPLWLLEKYPDLSDEEPAKKKAGLTLVGVGSDPEVFDFPKVDI